ncbi:uncharacterized protein [Amphiura filiformis]|uniref:uncharacterized protein n=1 Tax=Amphiura filiformis TaxID=82378 RepID=UPI003B224778
MAYRTNDTKDPGNYSDSLADIVHWGTPEGTIQREYGRAIKGFSSLLSQDSVKKLRQSEMVEYIEEDAVVYLASDVASWGLDRVDQRDLPLDNKAEYLGDGTGTHIYVIDSGILYTHEEFIGRTGDGHDLIPDFVDDFGYDMDCNGHGSHVAGIAAGSTYGIAINATLHGVRAFECFGRSSKSTVIQALEWVFENAITPAVCSMSISNPEISQVENDVIRQMVNAGIVVIAAAGNDNSYACESSPASAPDAIAVGATYSDDRRYRSSNFGRCVDIFAPGGFIPSVSPTSNNATTTRSGTSMACPHMSGAAAILLGINQTFTPYEVKDILLRGATPNKVVDAHFCRLIVFFTLDTCMTRCGSIVDVNRTCQCDTECSDRGDCCEDYANLCWEQDPTCSNRCGDNPDTTFPCQCNEDCWSRQDCCQDYVILCRPKIPCDSNVTYPGALYSPYYPENYLNNQTCRILIENKFSHQTSRAALNLIFTDFNLEESSNCAHDSLIIYDGDTEASPLIGTFCGTTYPQFIHATGQHLMVIFDTNSDVTSSGFRVEMILRRDCSVSLTGSGEISSTNFPSNYNSNQLCFYTMTAAPKEHVSITFSVFDIELDYDFLYFFDGNLTTGNALMGKASGNDPVFSPLKSTGEQLTLVFQSDGSVTSRGYQADFISVKSCNSTITTPGAISSANYPEPYYNNDICSTQITAPPGKQIRVSFTDFQLEGKMETNDTYKCVDYLQIYDASYANSDKLMGEFCGDVIPNPIRSSGRNLLLLFSSNFAMAGIGYKADVTFEEAVKVRLIGGRSSNEGRIEITHSKYGKGTVCDSNWDIKDASVVCKMRGYGAAREAPKRAYFGQGKGRVLLADVDCSGLEYNIGDCQHSGWNQRACNHRKDAGVICYKEGEVPLSIRIVDGINNATNAGRVEVRIGNEWGSVCDDEWDLKDADVVCRSLGYPGAVKALQKGETIPGDTTSRILFDNVECDGREPGLEFCLHNGVGNHNCNHLEDAGVECIVI